MSPSVLNLDGITKLAMDVLWSAPYCPFVLSIFTIPERLSITQYPGDDWTSPVVAKLS